MEMVASSPNVDDESGPHESPHTTITLVPSSNPSPSREAGPVPARIFAGLPFSSRAQTIQSLIDSKPHSMMLKHLRKCEKTHQRDASTYKKRLRRVSKDLYLILSMYALLQGVLFVAVAQSSVFTCDDWWGPVVIAGAATLVTLWRVLDKLRHMGDLKEEVKRSMRCQSAVFSKIDVLNICGSGCPIDCYLEPQISKILPASPAFLCLRGVLVLAFLSTFSVLMVVSCFCMLCHSSCNCSK